MATESNHGEFEPPVDFHLNLFPRLERVGQFIRGLFNQLHYEGTSDHHFEHPLDTPITPVTSKGWPNQTEPLHFDSEGTYLSQWEREA